MEIAVILIAVGVVLLVAWALTRQIRPESKTDGQLKVLHELAQKRVRQSGFQRGFEELNAIEAEMRRRGLLPAAPIPTNAVSADEYEVLSNDDEEEGNDSDENVEYPGLEGLPPEVAAAFGVKMDRLLASVHAWAMESGSVQDVRAAIAAMGDPPEAQALFTRQACEFAERCKPGSGATLFALLMI